MARTGYFTFFAIHFDTLPPGKLGISSTTWKISDSPVFSSPYSPKSATFSITWFSDWSSASKISRSSSILVSSSTISIKSVNFGAGGGGGGGFIICWVIGIISSSICSSAGVWNGVTCSVEDFHSKANNSTAKARVSPISKKTPFFPSRSAFGDFLISMILN